MVYKGRMKISATWVNWGTIRAAMGLAGGFGSLDSVKPFC